MADNLDQIIANENEELADLGDINTAFAAVQAEIAQLKAAATPPEDPRLTTLIGIQTNALAAAATLKATLAAAVPAPTPTPAPTAP